MGNVYTKSGALARRIYFGATLIFESLYALFRTRVLNDGGTFLEIDLPYTIDSEILLVTPNAYKIGKLYSAKPTNGTGDFTVDRNSTATYVGQDGLIKTALANVPRIDWSTGEAALLVEPQSTNLLTYSEDFNANPNTETLGNTTISIHPSILSPSGNLDSNLITKGNDSSNVRIPNIPGVESGDNKSIYARTVSGTGKIYLLKFNNEVADAFLLTEDWKRYDLIVDTSEVGGTNFYLADFRGSSNINEVLVWGAQIEQASTTSSYIPTNGTTVTRLADDISVPTPAGVTAITETIDGVEQTPITTIPATYSLPVGNINKVTML